ncbi:MAG: FecR domain-containing protein [Candidatus Saccharibacteria bacterium]|nr:FecR domain-containing protein [Rhodoferax sp.]
MLQFPKWMFLASCMAAGAACAQGSAPVAMTLPPGAVGVFTNVEGKAQVVRTGIAARDAEVYDTIREGDVLQTTAGSFVRVKMADGSSLMLRPNTQMAVTQFSFKETSPSTDKAIFSLLKGGFRAISGLLGRRNPAQTAYNTRNATIGIRGTNVGAEECVGNSCGNSQDGTPIPPGLHVDVARGVVEVSNEGGKQTLKQGESGFVKDKISPPTRDAAGKGHSVKVPGTLLKDPPPKKSNTPGTVIPTGTDDTKDTPITSGNLDVNKSPTTDSGNTSDNQGTTQSDSNNNNGNNSSGGSSLFGTSRSSSIGGGGSGGVSPN